MTIYLAAPWKHKQDAKAAREQFERAGITVRARWIDFESPTPATKPADDAGTEYPRNLLALEAGKDLEDIMQADAFVLLNLAMSEGKACETGIALMLGIPIVSVGKGRNVFLALPHVTQVSSLGDAIRHLTTTEQR